MGVQTRIVMYGREDAAAEQAAARAFARIGELDGVMSDYRATSEVMRLCRHPGSAEPISGDLLRVLADARRVSEASGGAFDVTVGPASILWRVSRQSGSLPDAAAIAATLALIDSRAVELDMRASTARLARPGVLLDLGGIAKGDAAEQARDVLAAAGFERTLVALAGDIAVGDAPPGQRGWRVAFEETPRGAATACALMLRNICVSTSGDAEQFVEVDGKRYAHIVDPRTALGTQGGVRVTVIHPRGTLADALATAICVMGVDGAGAMIDNFGAAALIDADRDGLQRRLVIDPRGRIQLTRPLDAAWRSP